jgi:hypothetical protein
MNSSLDAISLLPRGEVVLDRLPAAAVVIDGLAPAIGDGMLLLREHDCAGIVLCREGRVSESYCLGPVSTVAELQSRAEATVSAWRIAPSALDAVPSLLAGETAYEHLNLAWVEWGRMLQDLRDRGGCYVVTLITPKGHGVTRIHDGEHVASYTDAHPELGEVGLLDALAQSGEGSITVFRERAMPPARPALPPEPATSSDGADGQDAYDAYDASPLPAPTAFGSIFGTPQPPPNPLAESPTVAELAPQLKLMVRNRLELSAPRLEEAIDRAAARNASFAALAEEVRNTSIRGVMPSTLDQLADEIIAAGR